MKWIDVRKELPPIAEKECGGIRVWGCVQSPRTGILFTTELVYDCAGRFLFRGIDATRGVTHWMHLPVLPVIKKYDFSNN